ncbi:MAG: 50S ribosomal protein L13 [Patescibacteria group bacterium]
MQIPIKRKKIEIDASEQVVGRLATKIAMALMGKDSVVYLPHIDSGAKVIIRNVNKIRFTGKKLENKQYRHHSMHPGGLKTKSAKVLFILNPKEILIHAVTRMLPKNKMRTNRLKRISFKS